jgi:hypothetical protein
MPILEFYNETREKLPEITEKADREHILFWEELDPEYAYSWFESLAKAVNGEMDKEVTPDKYIELFIYLSSKFNNGNNEVRNCIDVAFTENLFWKITSDKAKPFWEAMPNNLKELYVNFHHKSPL